MSLLILLAAILSALTATALILALGAVLGLLLTTLICLLPLLSLLLTVLIVTLLFARFHSATQRLQIIGKLPRAIERIFQTLTFRLRGCSAFCLLQILQDFFEVAFDDPLTFARLVVPAVGDQLLVLADAIGNPILTDRARRFAKFVAGLLAVRTHSAGRLIDVPFEPRNLIGERLLSIGKLLLLVFAASALPRARKLVHAA